MKISGLLFLLLFINFGLFSQPAAENKQQSLSNLNVHGEIANAGHGDSCTVDLLKNNTVEHVYHLKKGEKKFDFRLNANEFYTLRISKRGFITSLLCIDTKCPSEIVDDFDFKFNITLVSEEEARTLKKDALDFPIAIIHFNPQTEDFMHNADYTRAVKTEAGLNRPGKNIGGLNFKF